MSDNRSLTRSFGIINRFCKPELVEEIVGNLEEFYFLLQSKKVRFKTIRYWIEVINYLRPALLKPITTQNKGPMLIINPRHILRTMLKHKSNTLISLTGFTIGLVSAIFLYFYIENEINYDSFHTDKDKIYRVIRQSEINGNKYDIGVTSGPFARALENDFPALVQSSMRVAPDDGLVTYKDISLMEDRIAYVDPGFFQFFSFPLAVGDPKSVLEKVNSVVISKELSKKYFGDSNPIGEILQLDQSEKYEVTGILDDLPNKSHLEYDMYFNLEIFEGEDWINQWWNNGMFTYVKVETPHIAAELTGFLPGFMNKYFGEDFKRNGARIDLTLEPLNSVHFSQARYDPIKHGNKNNINILTLVAFSILFIACFNYLNLSIAQSHKRAKEVGIRKVLGVSRQRLIYQFLGESLAVIILAVIAAIALSELMRPFLNNYFDLQVIFDWSNPVVYYFITGLLVSITVTAGVYPALLLSSFKPLSVLKGNKLPIGGNLMLRKGLVVAQFVLSTFLILATAFIAIQLSFVKNKDLGFNQEAILLVELYSREVRENKDILMDRIRELPFVEQLTAVSGEPGGFHDGSSIKLSGYANPIKGRTVFTDPNYLKTFGIDVVSGRGFNDSLSTERESAMIINEKMLADIGLAADEVIGKKAEIHGWDMSRTIVGVAKNFHFLSLRDEIEPLMIVMAPYHRSVAIKINSNNLRKSIAEISSIYDENVPNYPMQYYFQDDSLARQYENEETQAKIFLLFAGISILLASMGIFGLVSHAAQQRQKELGIRKILGAKVSQIIGLISWEFIVLVSVAALVAIPITIYFIALWLENFAYHIELTNYWIVFPAGGLITATITAATIALKTYRAAISNPVRAIRYE